MEVLKDRKKTHGPYEESSKFVQLIKSSARTSPQWMSMKPHQQETIDMVAHKLGRILYGNANFVDSWRDLIGYIQLSSDIIVKTEGATDVINKKIQFIDGEWTDEN